ncbi:glycine cleavage system protein R [Pandoraea nosoerga]|uniref:Glycine cleavage system protein R n=1 Tax=Pandoraea nosoerga TaxID=2508296 RepID=A0A5E4TGT4_9BURK|nr:MULTISPECIES: ACT domain-containing protein [Pandoraea]MBN4665476.1 glycine cleavage system protein R [Pandoraea nosoerga]MBN4675001.1 glycine cleavage system protein R [Pandoraea nosoerga]MBN4680317.1 glycine cleavage system protein R [Pandoraea nosoerga]MBN4744450.1 glycine cleavage system protein R [Pandoraea nosoerga]VVD87097.1 glycine cleavage system protein R [Pandoraea nosoerga]
MTTSLILNVIGPDRPGLVNAIADRATAAGANWLESRLANLAGQFAGIIHLQVPDDQAEPLTKALHALQTHGLRIAVTHAQSAAEDPAARTLQLDLVGQDHPGIVKEISHVLFSRGVSIDELATECVEGSMSGGTLFRATARLRVPASVTTEALRDVLESLADDLMVDVELDSPAGA